MHAATGAPVAIQHPPAAQEILVAMEERMHKTSERLESNVAMMQTKIHRFPRGLRGIGGDNDDRYIVPSIVAIGPYYHGRPHLQEMEEVKHAAAYQFCKDAGRSTKEVYQRILSLSRDARHCYASNDEAVARLNDAELAAMLLLDGCFLLQCMANSGASMFGGCNLSSWQAILKDIMLLENQIPWLVLDALTAFLYVDVRKFVAEIGEKFFPKEKIPGWIVMFQTMFLMKCRRVPAETESRCESTTRYGDSKPPHLLSLLRFSQVHTMPGQEVVYQAGSSSLLSTSAVELAQIGVKLTTTTATWIGDMSLRKKLFLSELSLSPLFLNDVTACWLVNMAALEATTTTSWYADSFVVSSYLSVLAMLMDREEDVHHLRANELLRSTFSNTQTMAFFKGLAQHLPLGDRYVVVLEQIEWYKRNRPLRIFVHRKVYGSYNTMTIASLFSIVGVLVGIYKTLISKK